MKTFKMVKEKNDHEGRIKITLSRDKIKLEIIELERIVLDDPDNAEAKLRLSKLQHLLTL